MRRFFSDLRASRRPWSIIGLLLPLLVVASWLVWQRSHSEPDVQAIEQPDLSALNPADREMIEQQQTLLRQYADSGRALLGEAYGELGRRYLAVEFFQAAGQALANAEALDSTDHRWPYLLGYIDESQARFEAAVEHYRDALDLEPENPPAMVRLAESLRGLGSVEEAETVASRVLELDADNVSAHYLLGLTANEQGDHEAAIEHLERVLELQPDAGAVRYPLAQAYRSQGDMSAAALVLQGRRAGRVSLYDPLIQETLDLRRSARSRMAQASRALTSARFEEAIELYREAIQLEPENVAAYGNLANVLLRIGRYEEARDVLSTAIALEPRDVEINRQLAIHALLTDRPDEAVAPLRIALEGAPEDEQLRRDLSEALFKVGRCEEAVPALRDRLADEAVDEVSRLRLAVCLVALGEHAPALAAIEEGLELDPGQPILRAALVRLLSASPAEEIRDGTRALEEAEALSSEQPGVDALEVEAMALAELGRFDEAVDRAGEALERLGDEGQDGRRKWLEASIVNYRAGRPLRQAWPPSVLGR